MLQSSIPSYDDEKDNKENKEKDEKMISNPSELMHLMM